MKPDSYSRSQIGTPLLYCCTVSEAQTADAQGGRQASLWELRSSPVPGETELGVPESEVAAAGVGQQRIRAHTISQRTSGVDELSTPYFI